MRILVTNDDGIHAPGLWALASELKSVGEVTVVAPDREQSGMGASVTLQHPVRMVKVNSRLDGVDAYSIEGTPADSVILGIKLILNEQFDLVVSGINEGRNLGDDVFISGTVGGAMQGYFLGRPAIAVSIAAIEDLRFPPAARLAMLLARAIRDKRLLPRALLNINFPNIPANDIKGIAITHLSEQFFRFKIKESADSRRNHYWIQRAPPQSRVSDGSDRWAVDHNLVSITALFEDARSPVVLALKEQAASLFRELTAHD